MKRWVKFAVLGVFVLSLLCAGLYAGAQHFLRRDFLGVSEVCRRWGERPLDVVAFRSWERGKLTRAAMACSLLKNQDDYVGMDRSEIITLFGETSGYYQSETHPTYMIVVPKTRGQDAWQIVFLMGSNGSDWKVSEVVVHKNCC